MARVTIAAGGLLLAAATLSAQDTAARQVTPSLIARGDSIFHGQIAGGTCFACHGVQGSGIRGLTHELTSRKRLNGDGSYRSIVQIVQQGVAQPQQAIPMPPHGGAELTSLDVQAVAAYVYSLSHPRRD